MNNTQIIILAAGKGTRMGGDIPKALTKLGNRSMLDYVVETAVDVTDTKPVTVVGYKEDLVRDEFLDRCVYTTQDEQKGTGHAVLCARSAILPETTTIVMLYADMPFVSKETLQKLVTEQQENKAEIVIATSVIDDDELFRNQFYAFGRIIRNPETNDITGIVEKKDSTEDQKEIREVNPAFFCCDAKWAFNHLENLKNDNAQGEYYLTDLVKIAFEEGLKIHSVQIEPREALGANTPEQLAVLQAYLDK